MAKIGVHIKIYGKVQGVFFRDNTRDRAEHHNIAGWVKNVFDNTVEAFLFGEEKDVNELIEWAHEGPSGAMVDRVEILDKKSATEIADPPKHFEISY